MGKREFLKRNCKSEHCNINFLKEISSAFDLIFAWDCNTIATSLTDKKTETKIPVFETFLPNRTNRFKTGSELVPSKSLDRQPTT